VLGRVVADQGLGRAYNLIAARRGTRQLRRIDDDGSTVRRTKNKERVRGRVEDQTLETLPGPADSAVILLRKRICLPIRSAGDEGMITPVLPCDERAEP
jgi:hypothetical protein